MTDSSPIFDRRAVFVIDVQKYLIAGPDAVPDALQVRQAIGGILESIRRHNDNNASMKTKIAFVQHDDKDPHDPLHNGKPTWELEFNPRVNDDTEVLVSKDVREYLPTKRRCGTLPSLSKLIKITQATCSKATLGLLKTSTSKVSLRFQQWACNRIAAFVRRSWELSLAVSTLKTSRSCRALIRHSTTLLRASPTRRSRKM
jgi:hypothetical protein